MEITVTQTVTIPEMYGPPEEVGKYMLFDAVRVWMGYDEGDFIYKVCECGCGTIQFIDGQMGTLKIISPLDFFEQHAKLIWLSTIDNYRHDWIEFAFKTNDATPDEYDDNTVDAVLQNMLYGKVIYG